MDGRESISARAWWELLRDRLLESQSRIVASNAAIERSDALLHGLQSGLIGFEGRVEAERQPILSVAHLLRSTFRSPSWGASMLVGRPKVLVIDDDMAVADTLALVLNASGFEAIAAYSGEAGIELARETPYDHLVSDVMMGHVNGVEAALAIQASRPACTVLLISGDDRTSQILANAIRDGHHFDILAKPVHPTVILDRLRAEKPAIRAD